MGNKYFQSHKYIIGSKLILLPLIIGFSQKHLRVDYTIDAGQYVSGLIETGKQLVSAVPKDAIVKANDKTYIFIYLATNCHCPKSNINEILYP